MRLSQGVEWGLHCCSVLALLPHDAPLPANRLAEFHGVPGPYLAKTLQALASAGLLESVPGRHGGYRLAKPPSRITLLDVVDAVEGGTFETLNPATGEVIATMAAGTAADIDKAAKAARSAANSSSLGTASASSAAPSSRSRSSNGRLFNVSSNQEWKSVPLRAAALGRAGIGRASDRAKSSGSRDNLISWLADNIRGSGTTR